MTDTQLLTLSLSIILPVSMLIYSNSRITDARTAMQTSLAEVKETLRAEIQAQFTVVNNKLDHLLEIVAKHDQKLGGK